MEFFFFFVKYNESNKKRNAKNGGEIDLLKKGEIREREVKEKNDYRYRGIVVIS